MLNEKEELFIKRMAELKFQRDKTDDLKYISDEYCKECIDDIMNGFGYEIMTDYDMGITHLPMYELDTREFNKEFIKMLPVELRKKVRKEHINIASYYWDIFKAHDSYSKWWNQMSVFCFMEKTAQKVRTVDEVNKLVQPDMRYWGDNDDPDLKQEMDDQAKSLTRWDE